MGKTGAQISAEAKVVSVLDAWTAMLADRPYRRALTQREARQQLLDGRGSQFDARVVDALMATLHDQATRAA